jgi:hypothetical protein
VLVELLIQNISRDVRARLGNISVPVAVTINRSSLTAARRDINRQIGNINANVNITVSANAYQECCWINKKFNGFKSNS